MDYERALYIQQQLKLISALIKDEHIKDFEVLKNKILNTIEIETF